MSIDGSSLPSREVGWSLKSPFKGDLEGLRVMMVGSAEESSGGVSSVIKLMKKMPVWEKYSCYWLGTQIQRNYLWKLWYAVKAAVIAPFIMWRYDIVHFHTVPDRICLIVQMPELLCAMLYGKRVVMHVHMGNQLLGHTDNGLFRWCLRRADRIVMLAERFRRLMIDGYGMDEEKVRVVYNACDTSCVDAEDINEKEKSIIMAGYFDDNKAPNLLIDAWERLREEFPEWRLTLMGNGDVERFKRMAHEKGLDDCICFPGYLTGKKKEEVWNKASILCLCSYNEGFPMVVLEAWTHGIAVVSTPVGGLADVGVEGKNMLTFDFGDEKGLADKLRVLMNDECKRKEMAAFSRDFVKENLSLEKVNDDLDALYVELI